jgi:hypothetical protein
LPRKNLTKILQYAKKPVPNITKEQMHAIYEIKNNNNIEITHSDKGNKTVILNKSDYIKNLRTF